MEATAHASVNARASVVPVIRDTLDFSAAMVGVLGFHVTSPHHKIPLNSRYHFSTPERIEFGHVSQVANVWFSSHNFGEVAVIQKFQYFQNFVWSVCMVKS